jgi:ABC-2 type transport system permease protein
MMMNTDSQPSSQADQTCPSPEQTLRKLFLTLFLRGRSSRGLQKDKVAKSVGSKLAWTLTFYALFGFLSVSFLRQPVFVLSIYLHAMTFVFLGMFIASSAGEILFNSEEADILLHRPVKAESLLWAKVRVLVEVSLWLAVAFNFVGFFVGVAVPDGGWRFPLAHTVSTTLQAMFCTGSVVMMYQLCLRWFGRERLDGLMTTAQVFISVAAVLSGQILPQMVSRVGVVGQINRTPWWIGLMPPSWFAGFDDALAGSGAMNSWLLMTTGLIATALVIWLSFGILARDYELGLQTLNERVSPTKKHRSRRRWLDLLVELPGFRWWLRDPVARASFVLSGAYLLRDRDVKLRVYPALAPILIMPLVLVINRPGRESGGGEFGVAFAGAYAGMVPLLGLSMLQFSQQWRAADIFRVAPIAGPAPICHGARRAVLCFLAMPALIGFGILAWFTQNEVSNLLLLIPGFIAMPVYALFPCLNGAVPLSQPTDEAKSTGRGLSMFGIIFVSMAIAGVATLTWMAGFFWYFVVVELFVAAGIYAAMRRTLNHRRWSSLE